MKKIPNIQSVKRYCTIACEGDNAYVTYHINDGLPTKCCITAVIPRYHRPIRSNVIVDENKKFINGYKVVITKNGEYAYVRESDHTLLPNRYDIAFDFNEYGLAIVGKNGYLSWINTEFKYLNRKGEMVEEDLDNLNAKFDAWQEVRPFSKGKTPLARLYDGTNNYGACISYLNTKGEIQKFYTYDGKIKEYHVSFRDDWDDDTLGTFNKDGIMYTRDGVLFAEGIYINSKDLFKLAFDKGFMDGIREEASEHLIQNKDCRGKARTRKN